MIFGYARASSHDQSTDIQIAALKAAGCDRISAENASGTTTNGRTALATLLGFLAAGDVVVVTRLDRLARSLADLLAIVTTINGKGAALRVLEQPVDTARAEGRLFLSLLGAFAEFETDLRRERQREGIEAAKAKGVYKGRKATIDGAAIRAAHAETPSVTAVAKRMGISRMSVYRALDETNAQ